MKKVFLAILLFCTPIMAMSQTYSQLWKNVEHAQLKDQPRTVVQRLQSIATKAESDREWGHLIKAQLQIIATERSIAPDSLAPQLARFEAKATKTGGDEALGAVYSCVLGRIYSDLSNNPSFSGKAGVMSKDSCLALSRAYFDKALANMPLLASQKANDYEPLVSEGSDSRIFANDLLHVVSFEAREYSRAADFYKKNGNNAAAMMASLYQIREEKRDNVRETQRSKYLARLDSLITEYQNLPETGEAAIEKFLFMDQATDITSAQKIEFIDYALRQWSAWPRMAVLKNARSRITLPSFHVHMPETTVIPDRPISVRLTSVINISRVTMTVTKLNMSGAEDFNPQNQKDMKMIRSLMASKPLYIDSRDFIGLPDYKEVSDSMQIIPLPVGVYLVEFTTNNKAVPTESLLLHVSNLRLLDMDMPGRQVRLIAVNATTGKPVGGAKITLQFRQWKGGRMNSSEEVLTTEQNGEVTFSSSMNPYRFRVTTQTDKAMPWTSISTSWVEKQQNANAKNQKWIQVYTDRSIYRPQQTVQASLLAYENDYYGGEARVLENKLLEVTLRDTNGKAVETAAVTTNEWGVASVQFTLPETDKNGWFSIIATCTESNSFSGLRHFRVEEYKRPSFTVEIDEYDRSYKNGDTITVRGWAKTYAGAPVQNAKVEYRATARAAVWWARYLNEGNGATETYTDEATTGEDGSFTMRLPIVLVESERQRHSFSECGLSATVTSLAGESHSANRYFPVSTKPTALIITNFAEKQCLEQLSDAKFLYMNSAGKEVEAELQYSIDGGAPVTVSANRSLRIDFSGIEKGAHTLRAYCGEDSLEQKFVLFSLDDEKPVIDTDAWYYDTPGNYDSSFEFVAGEPIRTQIGTSRQDQTVFYAIISDKEVLEEGTLVLNNQNHNRSFTYKEEWGEGIALRYSWARNGKVYTFAERLHKPEKKTELQLEWTTFRDRVAPGETEQWTIRVLNPEGKKAAAHMIATVYDKSLDVFEPHHFGLNLPHYSFTPMIFTSQKNLSSQTFLYGEQPFRPINEPELVLRSFDLPRFDYFYPSLYGMAKEYAGRRVLMASKATAKNDMKEVAVEEIATADMAVSGAAADVEGDAGFDDLADFEIRENLSETAAFMPSLLSDEEGNISIRFTLPDALTTWKFIGLAHDKQMNNGQITGEAIAQKPLMMQPNMPRFLREGDKTAILATITNTTNEALSGTATLQLLNPATEKPVYQTKAEFAVGASNTAAVSFNLPETLKPEIYICKIVAKTPKLSDGEQQYLPVISKRELITTTRAITQVKKGKKTVNLDELFGKNTSEEKVAIEYTNNPTWLMVDALPEAVKDCGENDNAVKYSAAIYAATLARSLKVQGVDAALSTDSLQARISSMVNRLSHLQNHDGSFSWYPDMPGSSFITLEVARNFIRLEHMLGNQTMTQSITTKAMGYLAKEIAKEVKDLKKLQKNGEKTPMPSELAMDYLYLQAIGKAETVKADAEDVRYLLSLLKDASANLSIYGKAHLAVAFALSKSGANKAKAQELMESVMQYSVSTEEMGRYFDTPKALISWRNYKIPTETAAIEALQALRPTDEQSIAEMRQWLLNEKRTQLWDTPINTTSAIYALLNGNLAALDDVKEPVQILLDGKAMQTSGKERGHFKTEKDGRYKKVVFDKRQDGMSFGAVTTYAQQSVLDAVEVNSNQLHVERQIIAPAGSGKNGSGQGQDPSDSQALGNLKVGDKITVRIILRADRDMDFVEIEDNRPACFEPFVQTSGYRNGLYESPRDTKTCYYINHVAKGRPVVIETEYYVDRAGQFESGLLTARCAYAPEFTARTRGIKLNIEN